MKIPEDYIEFLYWVKETTENFWNTPPKENREEVIPPVWIRGAKWLGLTDEEIDTIEKEYDIQFTSYHRAFLRILHTIDRKELVDYEDGNGDIVEEYYPFFYNWKTDKEEIKSRFSWPYETILDDVLGVNKVWLKSWGKRPTSDEKKKEIFASWFQQTPKLIPISSSSFVICEPNNFDNPILSVYGSDIIVCGWNMRHYLLSKLEEHLNLMYWEYDHENDCYCIEPKEELVAIHEYEYGLAQNKNIPIWEEMILYWSSGWSSFGRKYPYYPEKGPCAIVNTFIAEEE